MGKQILLVGFGGFIGSVARYLLSGAITKWFPTSFPIGTFIVNVAGCLFIGIIYGIASRFGWMTQEWKLFWRQVYAAALQLFQHLRMKASDLSRRPSIGHSRAIRC